MERILASSFYFKSSALRKIVAVKCNNVADGIPSGTLGSELILYDDCADNTRGLRG